MKWRPVSSCESSPASPRGCKRALMRSALIGHVPAPVLRNRRNTVASVSPCARIWRATSCTGVKLLGAVRGSVYRRMDLRWGRCRTVVRLKID